MSVRIAVHTELVCIVVDEKLDTDEPTFCKEFMYQ